MPARFGERMEQLRDAVLESSGEALPELRREVEARAEEVMLRPEARAESSNLPPALAHWVNRVALEAHATTDDELEALRKSGFSDDAIFELTIAASLGSCRATLARGLAAIEDSGGKIDAS